MVGKGWALGPWGERTGGITKKWPVRRRPRDPCGSGPSRGKTEHQALGLAAWRSSELGGGSPALAQASHHLPPSLAE